MAGETPIVTQEIAESVAAVSEAFPYHVIIVSTEGA